MLNRAEILVELHLDRRGFFFESWRTWVNAAAAFTRRRARITVAPMSDAWLRQHEADAPKHHD
jgi:hypothetical protein